LRSVKAEIRILRTFGYLHKNGGEKLDTIARVFLLLKLNKKSQKELGDALGVKQQLITDWKSGRVKSYMKYIDKIAEFLGVTADYLLSGEEKEVPAAISGDGLDNAFRKKLMLLTPEQRAILEAHMDLMLGSRPPKE